MLTRPVSPLEEKVVTFVHAVNPRTGPVSGGPEIWLSVEDLPTIVPLYARFGNLVTAAVSPMFHLRL